MKILYLSYTGLLEPLGRSQVVAYLEKLAGDHPISVVSFEKADDLADHAAVTELRGLCEACGIAWHPLRYHKRPRLLATGWDLIAFFWTAWRLCRRRKCLVHARSYLPAFVALALKYLRGTPFIFDMRAFWPDEMVTANRLRRGSIIYRLLKWAEHRCLVKADAVVCLTEAAVRHLQALPAYEHVRFHVVPTCADLQRFTPAEQDADATVSQDKTPFVLGCIGTVNSGWFRLDWLLAFFRELLILWPDVLLRVVTRDTPAVIYAEADRQGVSANRIQIFARGHQQMPAEIQRMHAGVMFFVADFSKLGSSPTRMGEILGCGVPCVANPGVGDVGEIIRRYDVGVLVEDNKGAAMRSAAQTLLRLVQDPKLPQRCRHAAEDWFSLERGVVAYDALYRSLADPR